MKKQLLSAILLFMLVVVCGITSGCPTGGGCRYKDYEGIVTINEIHQPDKNAALESSDEKLFIF